MSEMAASEVLRRMLDEREWRPVDLADRMEELRPGTRSEHHKVAVYRWLKGAGIAPDSAELLAEVFDCPAMWWLPAPITNYEYEQLVAELESLRQLATEAKTQNDELRAQLLRLERAGRRPQELLKPNAQRKAAGS